MSSRSAHIPTNRRVVTDLRARPSLTLCFLAACFMSAILRPFRRLPPSPRARPAGHSREPLSSWRAALRRPPGSLATRRRSLSAPSQGRNRIPPPATGDCNPSPRPREVRGFASHGWPNTFPKGAPLRTQRHPDRPPPADARRPIFRDSAQSTASCNTGISPAGPFEIKSRPGSLEWKLTKATTCRITHSDGVTGTTQRMLRKVCPTPGSVYKRKDALR